MTIATLAVISVTLLLAVGSYLFWLWYMSNRRQDVYDFYRAQCEMRKLLKDKFKDSEIVFPTRWNAAQHELFWSVWRDGAEWVNPFETNERIKKWLAGRDLRRLHNQWLAFRTKYPKLIKVMERTSKLNAHRLDRIWRGKHSYNFKAATGQPFGGRHRSGWKFWIPVRHRIERRRFIEERKAALRHARLMKIRREGKLIRDMKADGWKLTVPLDTVEIAKGAKRNRSYRLLFVRGEGASLVSLAAHPILNAA